ncbi:hypothetical protein B7H27_17340 [Stenotrophomonas maltophilia]|nr:hypothetical protein B7H27_17340 [Stenotrophomonas maltophilia]
MGEGALLAKHCFASARTHSRQRLGRAPEGDLQRPPQPDPPRHPTEYPLLLLLLLRPLPLRPQVQGCKPCRPTPSLQTTDVTLMRHARGCPPGCPTGGGNGALAERTGLRMAVGIGLSGGRHRRMADPVDLSPAERA